MTQTTTQTTSIPCHIVAGPLGVGKTSAILGYLRRFASEQRVGVLVNDFGPVGLDSTTLRAETPGAEVLNLPGGCICCSMLAELPGSIGRLTKTHKLDRLIIEPSGMAAPARVIGLLQELQQELAISVRPVIGMLSAAEFDEEMYGRMAYYRMFCQAADVLVLNRCDLAGQAKAEQAKAWAERLNPPKTRVLTTSFGALPREVFEMAARDRAAHKHVPAVLHAQGLAVQPGGVVLDHDRCFDKETLLANIGRVCDKGVGLNRVVRLKGVFRTDEAWLAVEIAGGAVTVRPSGYSTDTRMEWLTQPGEVDPERMCEELERSIAGTG